MRISKRIALALTLATSALSVFAQPNLKKLLTAEEWKAAGLDRLTSAEIAVLESALHRQPQPDSSVQPAAAAAPRAPFAGIAASEPARVATAPEPTSSSPAIVASPAPPQAAPAAASTAATVYSSATPSTSAPSPESPPENSRGWLSRFGLPDLKDTDWRKLPPLKAKVLSWESANRFMLDNGQAWEGTDPIPDELVGRAIEIHARPNNRFTLIVDGKNTKVRVIRVR